MISSYEAAALHMAKARSKHLGRPMKSQGWRLFQDGDEYVVEARRVQIGRFLPDNTFLFTTDGDRVYRVAAAISGTINRNLPFHWRRVGMKKYRVNHRNNVVYAGNSGYVAEFEHDAPAPQVYDGLAFNLFTGKCLNYRPDTKPEIDPDRRKEWLAASGVWKRKLKVMARLGVFDKLIADERAKPTPWQNQPRWHTDEWVDILYKAIKDNDHNTGLLRAFVAGAVTPWGQPKSSMDMYEAVDRTVKAKSVELRQRFGVFKGKPDDKFYI
jgi:hypothetical protein